MLILLVLTLNASAQTWSLKHSNPGTNYKNVQFPTLTTGYAVGNHGVNSAFLAKSIDTGNTWVDMPVALPAGIDILTDLYFVNKDTGVVTGSFSGTNGSPSSALIMRTTNGGTSWTTVLNLGTSYPPIYSVSFHGKDTGYAAGGETTQGKIYKTTDGGITWNLVYSSGIYVKFMCAVWALSGTNAIAVGNDEVIGNFMHEIWRAGAGSNSFTEDYILPNGPRMSMYDIQFPDPLHGYIEAYAITGSNYFLQLKTSDGGVTWAAQNTLPTGFGIANFHYKNAMFYATKDSGFIADKLFYATTDGGLTWVPQVVPAGTTAMNDEFFINPRLGFACGDGQILKYSKPGPVTPPNPVLTATVTADKQQICKGQQAQLTTTTPAGPVTYHWSPAAGLSCTTCANPIATPTATTTYTDTVRDGATTVINSITITVNPLPTIIITPGANVQVAQGGSITLTASGATTYTWAPPTYLNTTTGSTVISTPLASIIYTVTGTDGNGCTGTASVTLTVPGTPPPPEPTDTGVYIPNAFSPNGDGKNENFLIIHDPAIKITTLIFNKWGQEVYNNSNDVSGWDGMLKGEPAAIGVYAYMVTTRFPDGTTKFYKGNLTLLR